ncbi:MAG: hypothetical protein ABEJ46_06135, partial [Gemmatimonadota bacterium]
MTARLPASGLRRAALSCLVLPLALLLAAPPAAAQGHGEQAYEPRGSENIEVLSHIPMPPENVADIDIDQEMSRPYAYVARAAYAPGDIGMDIVDLSDPRDAEVIYEWRIENAELHQGPGALDPKVFEWDGREYVVQSFQFGQGGPNHTLGAIVFDVTSLPDTSGVEEVARIHAPESPGGFHNIFVYKHSNGRVYLFSTVNDPHTNVYDLGTVVEDGNGENALMAQVPLPGEESDQYRGYHDFYVGYHPASGQDRFYGGGTGGYFVYDVSGVPTPSEASGEPASDFTLLTSVTGVPGVRWGHTFTPGPRGRYAVGETEYTLAPLRIFDLKPGLDGKVETITGPISAWTPNWRHLPHNHEMRWPYLFVSAYQDGLQVVNLMDPREPKTVGWYDTYLGPNGSPKSACNACRGAFGVDVRNADGLIVISDQHTGFWAFRMEGFQGWSGENWGVPDVSSVQKWEE